MSDLIGFRCDVCGKQIVTGRRMTGNKAQDLHGEVKKYQYRFDLCDDCFKRIQTECKKGAQNDAR